MAILHVYFDESGKQGDHPLISVCGVCGPRSSIERFENEWCALLRKHDAADFHMVRASKHFRRWGNIPKQTLEERIEALKPFADCIADNLEMGLVQAWDVKGFKAISPEVLSRLGSPDDPYYVAFARAMAEIRHYGQPKDVISIICDYDIETAWTCYRHYLGLRKADPEIRKKTVSISFADDKYFPALQAADFVAYLTRLEAREQFYGIKNAFRDLFDYMGKDRGPAKMRWFKMFADEEKARTLLKSSPRK